jgi:gliding motility-associated-like protein
VSGLGAGVYNVTVTDAGGCTTTSTVTITNPAQLTASIASFSDATCAGGNDGTATAAGAGGTGGYSYNWNSSPVQTTQTATGLPAGNYIVRIEDANGCQSFANVTIGQPLNAVVALTNVTSNYLGQQVSCAGGCDGTAQAFGAGGTGPYTYAWSNGQTGPTATGLCSNTNYTVTVSDAVNCFSVATLTLSEPSAISLSTTQTAVSCNGGSDGTATVTAIGGTISTGYSYLWSNGQTTTTATGFAAGPHSVTVTDNNGCTVQTTVTITEPPTFLAVNIVNDTLYNGQQISCNGVCDAEFTVFASGGTGGFSYLWSNGSTATSQTGICPGVYTVTVSDSGGCGQISSITITSPSAVSATISSQTNVGCAGTATGSFTIAASGGTPGYTYNIGTGPLSSSLFNNLGAGTYTVTVSDLNFCETQVNVTITQPSTGISATTSVTTVVSCNNFCDGAATVTATGGTAPYTYSWSNGQTSQTATGLCGGANYTVQATDANGCEFITTLSMPNPVLLTANLQSTTDELCSGAGTGAATIAAGGGALPYSFNIGAGPQATGNFTGLTTGSYVVTVTDANGCSTTVPFIISGPPTLVINSLSVTSNYNGSQVSCAGACDGAATVVGAGGTGTYTFLWSNGQTTFTATGLCNAGAPYGVTVTDQNGCSVSGVVTTFTEPSTITLTATNQINIGCAGATTGSFEIVATGGTPNYSYNIGTGNQPTGLYSNLSAGIYCVTVTDANNCQDVICVTVSQTSQMVLTMTPITGNLSCANSANGSAQVQPSGGTAPYTYLWANGQTTSIATGLSGGSQCVTVTDANLCTATACVTITGPTAVDITVVSTTNASCFGVADGRITVQATGGTAPYIYSINGGTIFTNQVTFNNLTGTVSGFTYTIIVRDANGCQDTTTATMFSPSQVQVLLVNEEDVTCFGDNTGSVTVTGLGGTAPYQYSFQGGAFTSTNSFVDLIAGTYAIIVRDSAGCTGNLSVTISQPAALVLNIDIANDPSCNLTCDGQIQVSATGGTAPYTYSTDGSSFQTSGSFINLCEGTYPMTVEDGQGCQTTVNVTLTDPLPVSVTLTQTGRILCAGGDEGEVTAVASGGTGGFTYLWQPGGQTTAIATGLTAGGYSVTVTDANGCVRTASITISEPTILAATVVNQQNPSCNGSANGFVIVEATATTGTGPYTYDIGSGNQASGTFTGLGAGNYGVTVTDANGCTAVVPVIITEPAVLDAPTAQVSSNYNGSNISCANACDGAAIVPSPIIGGTAPYNFLWSTGETSQSISGLCAGTYGVTTTDANGCRDTSTVTVIAPQQLTATTAVTGAGCVGGSAGDVTVTANGGTAPYSYAINGGTAQTSNVFTNLSAGTYTIVITDANGCSVSSVAIVTTTSSINITATATSNFGGYNVSCAGSNNGTATATAVGGTAPYSYSWSTTPVQATQVATGLSAGVYTVTVTDNIGCSNTVNVTITEPAAITLTATGTTNPRCGGTSTGSISLGITGGSGPYIYSINGGGFQSGVTFNNLPAATHTIIGQDANGCRDTISVTLTEPTPLTVTVNATDVSCFGLNDGTATAVVSGGTSFSNGGYLFNWSPTGETTQAIGNLAGNINYTVTVEDANGCRAFGSAFVLLPAQLAASVISTTNVDCNGNGNGTATIAITGASGSYEISSDGGQTFIRVTSNPYILTNLSGGTYDVIIRDSVSSSCELPISVEILENNSLSLDVTTTGVSCFGDTDGTATVTVSGGAGPYSYAWSTGATGQTATGLASNFENGVFTGAPYLVTVTDGNGCTAVSTDVGINTPSELLVSVTVNSNVSCFAGNDGSATAVASGGNSAQGYSYEWSNGSTTQTATGLEAFNYTVTVTDARGCSATETVAITEPTFPLTVALSTDSVSCYGGNDGAIVIDSVGGGTPGYEYSFEENGPYGPASILENLPFGVYTVYVRDSNECLVRVDDLTVNEPADIDVYAFEDQTIRMGEAASVYATVNSTSVDPSLVSWYYYGADGTQNVVCSGAGCFDIDVNDLLETTTLIFNLNNGCNDTASVLITVDQTESVYVPNAFTPNGDGINDVFTVYGSVDVRKVNRLMVFDRWGELLYEATDFPANDLTNGWDGTFKTKKMNAGVYVYYTEVELLNGEKVIRKGDLTLLR